LEPIDARIYCDDGDGVLSCGAGDGGDHEPTPDWTTAGESLRNQLAIVTKSQTVAPGKQKERAQRRAREDSKFVSQ